MKLKKLLKSDTKKTYLKGERTYKVKEKVKKFKSILENETEIGRRGSIYTPLESDLAIDTPVVEKSKKSKRKTLPIEEESNDAHESDVNPAENGIQKKKRKKSNYEDSEDAEELDVSVKNLKKKKKKKKRNYEDSGDGEEPELSVKKSKKKTKKSTCEDSEDGKELDQSVKKSKKTKKIERIDTTDDNLNTSVSQPLISETEGSRDLRTIYIGNLPVDFKKKKLLKVLKEYGNVEKMWTRGAKPLSALPKKVALIKGKLPENQPPLMVHAVFKTIAEAHNALKLNGELYDGNRLRVTMSQEKVFDSRKGVFVGNLPFEIEDGDLFDLFQQCGEIVTVRVVRDGKTGAGKGFGYVNFKSVDSVELALNLNEEKISGREIRVQRLFSPGKKKKMDKKKKKQLLKANTQTEKPLSAKKTKPVGSTEKRPKKKNKLKLTDLKKKIMAKKLSIKSKKVDA